MERKHMRDLSIDGIFKYIFETIPQQYTTGRTHQTVLTVLSSPIRLKILQILPPISSIILPQTGTNREITRKECMNVSVLQLRTYTRAR